MDDVIQTQILTKRYGSITAVDQLSLRVPRGGVFGLLGPNGSGKTTTMGMLLGLVKPTSGTIRLFGLEGGRPTEAALARIGAVVETPAFYPYLSAHDNLRYFQGISRRGKPDDIQRLLKLVGLQDRAKSKFRTYSMGMKQRLGIACALLGDPELLILDEPTNGLDPAGMTEVRELIRSVGNGGRTVLLSSHLLHEVEQVCDQIAILSKGRLIAQGPVADLLRQHGALRVRTTNDARAAALIRSSLPWVADVGSQDGHLVVTASPERSWEITAALAEEHIYVGELVPIQMSLEDYFLEITRPEGGQR
ncbi:MAG: ABC transporter ATP-binding protein [Chloroflexi bacterium]|nr:ABC transporter ATP-binding protein [Chloroflexota bacterium]